MIVSISSTLLVLLRFYYISETSELREVKFVATESLNFR